ncbi:hypothetical protein FA13DRAFT_1663305, partial [Coprinellus micaceus]
MDPAATGPELHFQLPGLVRNARIVSYFNVASCCIMIYDVLITLDEEVRSIWSGRLSWSKLLYLFVRYSTIFEVGVILWADFIKLAWALYRSLDLRSLNSLGLFVIGLAIGEMIMSMRTWAVWKRDKKLGIALAILWPICWISGFTITGIWLQTVRFDPSPMAQFQGCFLTDASQLLFVAWLTLLLYDTVNFVLICIPAYHSFRLGGGSHFVKAVYTDGIVYYAYLFALSAANIVVVVTMPRDLQTLLSMMERVLHAVFTCRMVLHIHSISRANGPHTEDHSIPTYTPGDTIVLKPLGSQEESAFCESTVGELTVNAPEPPTHALPP